MGLNLSNGIRATGLEPAKGLPTSDDSKSSAFTNFATPG